MTLAGGPAGRWPHAESRDAGGEGGGETALLTSQGPPLAEEETEAQFSVWASPRPDYLLGHVHPQPATPALQAPGLCPLPLPLGSSQAVRERVGLKVSLPDGL